MGVTICGVAIEKASSINTGTARLMFWGSRCLDALGIRIHVEAWISAESINTNSMYAAHSDYTRLTEPHKGTVSLKKDQEEIAGTGVLVAEVR